MLVYIFLSSSEIGSEKTCVIKRKILSFTPTNAQSFTTNHNIQILMRRARCNIFAYMRTTLYILTLYILTMSFFSSKQTMTPGLIVNYCPSIATRLGSNSFIAYSFVHEGRTSKQKTQNIFTICRNR